MDKPCTNKAVVMVRRDGTPVEQDCGKWWAGERRYCPDCGATLLVHYPTEELKNDLAKCNLDIKTLKKSMADGYTHYKGDRLGIILSAVTLIKRDIEEELARREL